MTRGPVGRQLLLFALPILGASFIQQLYNTVDLFFVGQVLGTNATAAVGASSLLTTCIVGFFTGLAVGTGVVISQAAGEKNQEKIHRVIHTAAGLSLAGGVLLTILGVAVSRQILIWMNTPAEILEQALLYVRVYLLSMLPLFIYNINAGIIRAKGDSRTPMLFQLLGMGIHVILNWICLNHLGMDVDGAAWSTLLSQIAAAAGTVLYLMRQRDAYHLQWSKIRIHRGVLASILRLGVPAGIQNMVITISNIFVQTAINGLGVDEMAAFTAYFKVELVIYLPIVALGQAVTTFAGQNLGAGKKDRIEKGVRSCLKMGILYAAAAAVLLLLFGAAAFRLFTAEQKVIEIGLRIIRVTFPFYWLYVILEVCADALRGIGQSFPPMLIILICMCAVRTVLLAVFCNIWNSLEAVAAVYPCAWLAAAFCLALRWKKEYNKWKRSAVS